jgi:hypothetical protein
LQERLELVLVRTVSIVIRNAKEEMQLRQHRTGEGKGIEPYNH